MDDEIEQREPSEAAKNLESMSLAELEAYIDELQEEIGRARATIVAKHGVRSTAEALFRR